jgi:uncharacterized protein (TIGR03437 family)
MSNQAISAKNVTKRRDKRHTSTARKPEMCTRRCPLGIAILFVVTPFPVTASEADALAISAKIQSRFLPFGTILEPIYASATSNQIIDYTDCGDSALWTGAYLAAEAFRYNVTQSADALNNVRSALAGLQGLADVTGDNRLARCMVRVDSQYAASISNQESSNTIHQTPTWIWVDNTSRDELVGAFFGLGAAFDLVNDSSVRSDIGDLATLLLGFIADHEWSPNDDISNTFLVRPEELHMLLVVDSHVNPGNHVSGPLLMPPLDIGVDIDVLDNSSYYKFNLDYMTFFNLVRLGNDSSFLSAYQIVRNYTTSHQNAFFDMVDRALQGPNSGRDSEARELLDEWLLRPVRDPYVDLTNTVEVCGSEACSPVPVPLRPPTDFLWQRDPFQLTGGGTSTIESPGIDYILPYWMGRYYGVISPDSVQSAAAPSLAVAPGSLATMYGSNLAAGNTAATALPLPISLGGLTLSVTDATGAQLPAALNFVSPGQVNFVVPSGAALGDATFTASNGSTSQTATTLIQNVAPTLFSMSGTGMGVAAATALEVPTAQPQQQTPVSVFECTASGCTPVPINVGVSGTVYLTLYGTGIRNLSSLANVQVTVAGLSVPVQYAGAQPSFPGLDQVNVSLPAALRGAGDANVVLTLDGQVSNTVMVNIQ